MGGCGRKTNTHSSTQGSGRVKLDGLIQRLLYVMFPSVFDPFIFWLCRFVFLYSWKRESDATELLHPPRPPHTLHDEIHWLQKAMGRTTVKNKKMEEIMEKEEERVGGVEEPMRVGVGVSPPLVWSGSSFHSLPLKDSLISHLYDSFSSFFPLPPRVSSLSIFWQITDWSIDSLWIAASHYPQPGRIDAWACRCFSVFCRALLLCSKTINEGNLACWQYENAAEASKALSGKFPGPDAGTLLRKTGIHTLLIRVVHQHRNLVLFSKRQPWKRSEATFHQDLSI